MALNDLLSTSRAALSASRLWPGVLLPGLLTLVALLPWRPEGPYDARTLQRIEGAELVPVGGAWLEPFLAPGHVLLGAPDFRLAILSTLVWGLAGIALWSGWSARGSGIHPRALWRWGVTTARRSLLALLLLFAYLVSIAAVNHVPGWQLVVDDDEVLIADLQSHTTGSHDGIAPPQRNLDWHRARGYDVVAVTEHYDLTGAFHTASLAGEDMLVLTGVEERDRRHDGFLLGIGMREGVPHAEDHRGDDGFARRFIEAVHEDHGGAVIALAWRLTPEEVREYAEFGVDGFEIANMGHPDVPLAVRDTLLSMQVAHGSALVASSDWHGWGGFNRTWTLIRLPGVAEMDDEAREAAIIDTLRERGTERLVPVVAGELGPPPTWRLLLAPVVETIRYAGELSLERVMAWWFWFVVFALLAARLKRRGREVGQLFAAGGLLVMAGVIASRGVAWLNLVPLVAGHTFPAEAGRIAMGMAALCTAVGLFMLRRGREPG